MTGRALYGCRHVGCRATLTVVVDDGVDGAITPELELRHVAEMAAGRRVFQIADGLTAAATALGWTSAGMAGMNCPAHAAS